MLRLINSCVRDGARLTAHVTISEMHRRYATDYVPLVCRGLYASLGRVLQECGRFSPEVRRDVSRDQNVYRVEVFALNRKELEDALEKAYHTGREDAAASVREAAAKDKKKVKEAATEAFVAGLEIGLKAR